MLGSKKAGGGSAGTTLVATDTTVVGDIHFKGSLDVEGVVQGDILSRPDAPGLVRVIDGGRVEGEIRAPSIVINGQVEGDVYAGEHLELAPRARVNGDVYYKLVEMAAGAEVNGALRHQPLDADEMLRSGSDGDDPSIEVTEVVPESDSEDPASAKIGCEATQPQ
ncbi:MAG: polymer-forming cytoskeletal protein [Pseudomonadota bacterium]